MSSSDNLVPCPYNPTHMIRQTRMAYHLPKCRLQHPGVVLSICPYNATHQFPPEQERVRRILNNTRSLIYENPEH